MSWPYFQNAFFVSLTTHSQTMWFLAFLTLSYFLELCLSHCRLGQSTETMIAMVFQCESESHLKFFSSKYHHFNPKFLACFEGRYMASRRYSDKMPSSHLIWNFSFCLQNTHHGYNLFTSFVSTAFHPTFIPTRYILFRFHETLIWGIGYLTSGIESLEHLLFVRYQE